MREKDAIVVYSKITSSRTRTSMSKDVQIHVNVALNALLDC